MIKPLFHLLILCCICSASFAQTNVELNIQHKFEKSNFVLGQPYIDDENRTLLLTKIQYYLSDIELIYDGEQSIGINQQHFLIDGQTDSYNLGTVAATIQELEFIDFKLGIDEASNLNSPSTYSAGHPLAEQQMYSTKEQSYIFVVIEGMIDSDNDQNPDKAFTLKATGDQLLRQVSIQAKTSPEDNTIKINLVADISSWLKNIDLGLIGIQENSGAENELLCDNTIDNNVFFHLSTTNVSTIVSPKNHIHIDSRLSYAPTIHYKFYSAEQLDMTITNINGSYFIQRFNLAPDGDFFMSDDLASGIYIVIFTSPKGIRQSKRFVIRN